MNEPNQTRRRFLSTLAGGATAMALPQRLRAETRRPDRKPNVLLILVDDLGYTDLSCYGAKDAKTPNLDRLVGRGMRIDPFYANCPVCSPTRAAVLTGRYPDLVGVPGVIRTKPHQNFGHLTQDAVLLPKVLKRAGYHTAIVGKWHLGLESPNTPNDRGFDHFHGFLGDMMDDYYTHRRHGINYMRLNDREIDPKGHATDLFTQWAGEYIRERAETDQPWFLYLAYNAPHSPIQPPPEWIERVKKREPGIDNKRAKFLALVEHMDDGIGKVLQTLEARGQRDDTLVIFTSDNGGAPWFGANNDPLNGGKQDMFEGGVREPMCAVWPGKIRPGSRSDRVTTTMDLFPTICQAAGAEFDHEIDGQSVLPTLLGKDQVPTDRFLFWMRLEGGKRYKRKCYYAARHGRWKLLQNTAFEPLRLYDLKADPYEQNPLPDTHPQYKVLRDALQRHIDKAAKVPWQRPDQKEES